MSDYKGNNDDNVTKWIDISLPIRNGMVHWPGDPPVQIERVMDLELGDSHVLSKLSLGSHTGTHIDAPLHFIKGGMSVSEMPLNVTNGRARVIGISDKERINIWEITGQNIRKGQRVLFKTRNSTLLWNSDKFDENFVFMSEEAARFLVDCRVDLVGVDYLSVGGFKKNGAEIHRILLEAGIWIIEGLNLSGVIPGEYELICLPLKITGGDAAPARAALKRPKGLDPRAGV